MRGYRIDHVIYAVRDVDVVTDQFAIRYGLAAVPGGMHPTWGTANRIVPLGDEYLELVHVVDPEVAAANDFGRGSSLRSNAVTGSPPGPWQQTV